MLLKYIVGLLAGIITTFSSLPQIIKCIRTRDTSSLSENFLILITTGVFLWFLYGIIIKDINMVFFNFIGFVLWLILLILKIKEIINNRTQQKNNG